MDPFSMLIFPNGKIAFQGTVRCNDEGVDEFRIELPNRNPMYGEWRPKFTENGNDFAIEVITFGYGDKYNVRNSHPSARACFSVEEQLAVEELVRGLFANQFVRIGIPPFSTKKARFLGGVSFLPGWIACSDI